MAMAPRKEDPMALRELEKLRGAAPLQPRATIPQEEEPFCARFSPDGDYLASGLLEGGVQLIHVSSGQIAHVFGKDFHNEHLPCTTLAFRPEVAGSSTTRHVLMRGNAHGDLEQWHATSGKKMASIHEEGNHIYAMDYRPDGALFASGGRDCKVRVYDEATKKLTVTLEHGNDSSIQGEITTGHSNRVFAVRFHPTDANVVMSAGWDNTIQIWDTRVGYSVRSIFGPHICGDALDVRGNTVLTGSWRREDPLQLWDYATGKLVQNIPFPQVDPTRACFIYSAKLGRGPSADLVAAGGSDSNEVRVLNYKTGAYVGRLNEDKAIHMVEFSPDGATLAVGSQDKTYLIKVP
eukprot:jgi/Mesvir1/21863/Mv04240-RA.1